MDPITLLSLMARTRAADEQAGALADGTVAHCRRRLQTVTTVEAATAVVSRAVAVDGGSLATVAGLWWARTPDQVLRNRNAGLGDEMLAAAGREPLQLPRAVVIGMLAAEAGIEAPDLARMVGYDDVQAVLAGVLVARASAYTAELFADVLELADRVAGLTTPFQIPDGGANLGEVAAAQ